jgi:hypothetical protein
MFKSRTSTIVVCVAAVAAVGLLSPKAAHAVAAALVQVTNTIANPAITQPTVTTAAQQVMLTPPGGEAVACCGYTSLVQAVAAGDFTLPYVVPAGQNLIVTGMDATAFTGASSAVSIVANCNSLNGLTYQILPVGVTVQARYPAIVIPTGCGVSLQYLSPNNGNLTAVVFGYLTAN